MKQTAIEWLEEKWNKYDLNLGKSGFNLFLKQAQAMEKKQIMNAWMHGFEENQPYIDSSEDYYNETFKPE
jgi:hypothetical protein